MDINGQFCNPSATHNVSEKPKCTKVEHLMRIDHVQTLLSMGLHKAT